MKKLLILTFLTILVPMSAICANSVWGMRSELWQKNNEFEKFVYVQGVFDGMVFSNFTVHETKLSMGISVSQYVKAINNLYSDYKNSLIPIPFLLRIITLELKGTGKAVVEKELEAYRMQFSK